MTNTILTIPVQVANLFDKSTTVTSSSSALLLEFDNEPQWNTSVTVPPPPLYFQDPTPPPGYSSLARPDERVLLSRRRHNQTRNTEFIGQQHIVPTGFGSIKLFDQPPLDVGRPPTYGRGGLVRGSIQLSNDIGADSVQQVIVTVCPLFLSDYRSWCILVFELPR